MITYKSPNPTAPQSFVEVFIGHLIEDPTEKRFLKRLRIDLEEKKEPSIILANFYVGSTRTQIDCVVITERGATVVEIKGFRYPVYGDVNGPWKASLGAGRSRVIATKSPYQQALDARHAISDELSRIEGFDTRKSKRATGGNLCLFPEPLPGSSIPEGNFKCTVGGYSSLTQQINQSRSDAQPLEIWRNFAAQLGLQQITHHEATSDEIFVAEYGVHWTAAMSNTSKPFVELPLDNNGTKTDLAQCVRLLNFGRNLFILGSAGSGKSRLLEELSVFSCQSAILPIVIEAGLYEGDLRPLLAKSVAQATTLPLAKALRAAQFGSTAIVIFVDGFNECPAEYRKGLLRGLLALRLRHGVQFVLSSQTQLELPWESSTEDILNIPIPTPSHLQRVFEAHLSRQASDMEIEALEVASTAHDAVLLAEVVLSDGLIDGRFSLYATFTRQRLAEAKIIGVHEALSKVALQMRERFISILTVPEFIRNISAVMDISTNASRVFEASERAGLLIRKSGKIGFRHELIGDYFSTEALLAKYPVTLELHSTLERPLNAPLIQFAVGGCTNISQISVLLSTAPPALLIACLKGHCGAAARKLVLDFTRDALERLVDRYRQLVLKIESDQNGRYQIQGALPPRDSPSFADKRLLSVLPYAIAEGLWPDTLSTFSIIDSRIEAEAKRLRREHGELKIAFIRRSYDAVYGVPGLFEGGEIHDIQQSFMLAHFKPELRKAELEVRETLFNFETLTIGQLMFATDAYMCMGSYDSPPLEKLQELATRLWDTGLHPLRIAASELIRMAGRSLNTDAMDQLRLVVEGWLSENNPFVNSLVFDVLKSLGGPETGLTVESVLDEYLSVLAQPRSEDVYEQAMHLYVCTFDHPCDELYCEAYNVHLTLEQRKELLVRAIHARYGDMTTPWVVHELFLNPHIDATAKLQEFARSPIAETASHQFSVEAYIDAIAALAKLGTSPLESQEQGAIEVTAWEQASMLLYVFSGETEEQEIPSDTLKILWNKFENCGVPAALDVVMNVELSRRNFRKKSQMTFLGHCNNGLRRLARAALQEEYQSTTIFSVRGSWDHLIQEHRRFSLQLLGEIGRSTDLELIKQWVEDKQLGFEAISAARKLELII